MIVLRAAERVPTPWKNGGGVTREVAIWPPGAPLTAFDWRISVADVAAGGPFSAFPGIDRVLTVISGAGLFLTVDGAAPVAMDDASPPLAFPGEAACEARLAHGPIRDLNLMVRRGAYAARARRMTVADQALIGCEARMTLLLALDPLRINGEPLTAEDAVLAEHGEELAITAPAARLVIASIEPVLR